MSLKSLTEYWRFCCFQTITFTKPLTIHTKRQGKPIIKVEFDLTIALSSAEVLNLGAQIRVSREALLH